MAGLKKSYTVDKFIEKKVEGESCKKEEEEKSRRESVHLQKRNSYLSF
jgi:hypothetical protein